MASPTTAAPTITWLRWRAEGGDRGALKEAAWLLKVAGRVDEAITVYLQAAELRARFGVKTPDHAAAVAAFHAALLGTAVRA